MGLKCAHLCAVASLRFVFLIRMKKNAGLLRATGLVLRKLRIEAGLSQEELAARSGLSRSMIDKIERRERLPSLDVLFKLSKGLKIDTSEIVQLFEMELRL